MIRPVDLQADAVWLHHDRRPVNGEIVGGHDGVVNIRTLGHPLDHDGVVDVAKLVLPCPREDCPFSSTQPIGGGGLSPDDTRTLQQVFVAIFARRLMDEGWPDTEAYAAAMDDVAALIEQTDGVHRNELLTKTATPAEPEESSMPIEPEPTLVAPDLGDAIINEIDRTLDTSFKSPLSPIVAELLGHIVAQEKTISHRNAALRRIGQTLVAANEMRDKSVTE